MTKQDLCVCATATRANRSTNLVCTEVARARHVRSVRCVAAASADVLGVDCRP
jgi:hypothetical protein